MADQQGFYGQLAVTDPNNEYNAHSFHIDQKTGEVRTGVPVKIIAVHGGGVGPPPTVDVQPLINQIDSAGKKTDHGIIYGLATTRNQGGTSAVINDPVVGDIGYMVIADRDISSLKANAGAQSNPGSFRRHDLADGVYMGKMLGSDAPTNYIHHLPGGGFKIADQFGNSIVMNATGITMTDCHGNIIAMKSGSIAATTTNLTSTGGVQAGVGGSDSVTLQHHLHAGGPPPDPGT